MTSILCSRRVATHIMKIMGERVAPLRCWRLDLRQEVQREGITAATSAVCGGVLTALGRLTAPDGPPLLAIALFALGGLLFWLAIVRAVYWTRLTTMERNS